MSREAILANWAFWSSRTRAQQQTRAEPSGGGQPVEVKTQYGIKDLFWARSTEQQQYMWKNVPSLPRRRDWWRLVVGLLALQVHRVVSIISQSTWLRRAALRDFPLDRPLTPSSQEDYDSDCERDSD